MRSWWEELRCKEKTWGKWDVPTVLALLTFFLDTSFIKAAQETQLELWMFFFLACDSVFTAADEVAHCQSLGLYWNSRSQCQRNYRNQVQTASNREIDATVPQISERVIYFTVNQSSSGDLSQGCWALRSEATVADERTIFRRAFKSDGGATMTASEIPALVPTLILCCPPQAHWFSDIELASGVWDCTVFSISPLWK